MNQIIALVVKEFIALFKDKRARFVVIVPPLIQLLVFGYAASFDLNRVTYAVFDRDGGPAARALLAHFEGSPTFELRYRIRRQDEIAALIDAGEVLLVLQIDPDFDGDLLGRHGEAPAKLQVIIDGRNSNTAQVAQEYVNRVVADFNRHWIAAQGLGRSPPELAVRAWYNPNLESRWFFVSGLVGLLTLVVAMMVTAMSVAREREQGTFDQLLVTPLHPAQILIGKAMPGLLIGVFEASLVVLAAVVWFGVPLVGSLAVLYTGMLLFLLAAVGAGLMISSLALTMQQALLGTFLFMVPAAILSGFSTPIANMPEPVQWLTLANPLRYYLIIVRGVFLEGAGFSVLLHQMWPLALIALLSLSAATWLFRHRMD
ncbi:ABC transporter permease [Thiohalocapsa marina]|uniref:ABC transporter permease n=1 Tax=Thiohalocapsa marina TaxID=424902 RepID=A0A5M8FF35_9GAMM|nr:ABC transporter permease [Thiohalocapsa marina]KAA6183503.1 ABC transporter permease [Thiohalocapsa marina]